MNNNVEKYKKIIIPILWVMVFFIYIYIYSMKNNISSDSDSEKETYSLRFGNRIYSADQLNQLSILDKEKLIEIANPSCFKSWQGYSNEVVSREDFDEITAFLPEEMKKGLHIKVIESIDKQKECCIRHWPKFCAGITFFGGLTCLGFGIGFHNPVLIMSSLPYIIASPLLGCILEWQIETSRAKTIIVNKVRIKNAENV